MLKRSIFVAVLLWPVAASAHFLELWPGMVHDDGEVKLRLAFGHPYRGEILDVGPPVSSGYMGPGITEPQPLPFEPVDRGDGVRTYAAEANVSAAGDYMFYAENPPYFEPDEGVLIRQYAKVFLNSGGKEGNWAPQFGLPVEIVPMSRPYATLSGSTFTGKVIAGGEPAAGVTVEVTLARGGAVSPHPGSMHDVATLITDANGTFTIGLPSSGWWGFSAVTGSGTAAGPDGNDYPLEVDAVFWIWVD